MKVFVCLVLTGLIDLGLQVLEAVMGLQGLLDAGSGPSHLQRTRRHLARGANDFTRERDRERVT